MLAAPLALGEYIRGNHHDPAAGAQDAAFGHQPCADGGGEQVDLHLDRHDLGPRLDARGNLQYLHYVDGSFDDGFRGALSAQAGWTLIQERLEFVVEDYLSRQPIDTLAAFSPGNEQRDFWGSAAADRPGSRNVLGIKDSGIDALIDRVIFAKDRPELVAATRALDRVLLAHDYVVPQWSSRTLRTVRWNRFGKPDKMPKYASPSFPTVWWYDEALAGRTGAPR